MLLNLTTDHRRISLEGEHLIAENVSEKEAGSIVPLCKVTRVIVCGVPALPLPVLLAFPDRLQEIIDPVQDSVMVIPVCGTCRKKIHVFGQGKLYEEPLLFQL